MIVLDKDKVDERFNISDDGIITDLQGNVQQTKKDRYEIFKSIAVHRIQMYTKYGWFSAEEFEVHHKDYNKLNNQLSNLILLSPAEHRRIHSLDINRRMNLSKVLKGHPGYMTGKKHSEETKKKISEANKGKTYSRIYKPLTLEQKQNISKRNTGKIWINNGIVNKFVYPNDIPNGFELGMIKRK